MITIKFNLFNLFKRYRQSKKIKTEITGIKSLLFNTLDSNENESILWLEGMPIYNYMGVKGLYFRKDSEEVFIIEDNSIYNINKVNDPDKISAILEVARMNYFELGYKKYCTKR